MGSVALLSGFEAGIMDNEKKSFKERVDEKQAEYLVRFTPLLWNLQEKIILLKSKFSFRKKR